MDQTQGLFVHASQVLYTPSPKLCFLKSVVSKEILQNFSLVKVLYKYLKILIIKDTPDLRSKNCLRVYNRLVQIISEDPNSLID